MIDCQVLVAGGGPVGTLAAIMLAQAGLSVILVERNNDCATDLRASTFHAPTLEILDDLGLATPMIAMGLKAPIYHFRERATGETIEFDLSELSDATRFPFRLQCEQFNLTRLIADRLNSLPNAKVLFGHRLMTFEQDESGVSAVVEAAEDVVRIRASYLIGADGASSVVRKLLGISLTGYTISEKFLCMTTTEPLEEHLPDLAAVNYVSDPREWMVLLRVPAMWRVLVPETTDDAWLLSDERKRLLFEGLIGKADVRTEHRTIYQVHQRVANRFRDGRAVLVGDAAHLNNPLGGFGMNSGIHDAANLCDKLIRILKDGEPADHLLDQFERQRHAVSVDFIQQQTVQNHKYLHEARGEAHALRKADLKRISADASLRRAYLLRQSMLQSRIDEAAIH